MYLQSTGFALDPAGKVMISVYSSGVIGRLVPDDVAGAGALRARARRDCGVTRGLLPWESGGEACFRDGPYRESDWTKRPTSCSRDVDRYINELSEPPPDNRQPHRLINSDMTRRVAASPDAGSWRRLHT